MRGEMASVLYDLENSICRVFSSSSIAHTVEVFSKPRLELLRLSKKRHTTCIRQKVSIKKPGSLCISTITDFQMPKFEKSDSVTVFV